MRTNDSCIKGCVPFLLKKDKPFTESPIKGKSIKTFHHEINMYLKKHATADEKKKIERKYQEFSDYLVSRENNKYYAEALIFEHVISGNDHISNYSGKELLDLYCYFNFIYSKEAAFKEEGIIKIRKQFSEVVKEDSFDGIYNLEYRSEKVRCLNDALEGKYELSNDELNYFENEYFYFDPELKRLITKVYQKVLNIGQSNNLTNEELKEEFERLNDCIKNKSFDERYGRSVNLIDMYLMTNIQVDDFNNIQNVGLDIETCKSLLVWFKNQFSSKIKYDTKAVSLNSITKIMAEPSKKIIEDFNSNIFNFYNYKVHNQEDLNKTMSVLYDLNSKYGVKIDQFNYLILLESIIWGEFNSYYEIGEEYKSLLNEKTHVEVNANPILTRRKKNEE